MKLHYLALCLCLAFIQPVQSVDLSSSVVHAINCGGPSVKGAHGVVYKEDSNTQGEASEHGKRYTFINAPEDDRAIYQTERWSHSDLTYTFPLKPGKYALILKFSEVYFSRPREKLFDVHLNGVSIIKNLDIFSQTRAPGLALDKYFDFEVRGKELHIEGMITEFNGNLEITFVKGLADNPKVNGIVIVKGTKDKLPAPPAPSMHEDENEDEMEMEEMASTREHEEMMRGQERQSADRESIASGPPSKNPYDERQDNTMVWIIGTIVAAIPVIYLLRSC